MTDHTTGTLGAVPQDTAPDGDRPLVELRGAGKSYGNIRALHGVDLTVHPSRVTCVLGDNGAGKSTLIKIVSGLHQHTEGEFLDGDGALSTGRLGAPADAAQPPPQPGPPAPRHRPHAEQHVLDDEPRHPLLLGHEVHRPRGPAARPLLRRPRRPGVPQFVVLETDGGALSDVEIFVNCGFGYQVQAEAVCERGTARIGDGHALVTHTGRPLGLAPSPRTGPNASPRPTTTRSRPGSTPPAAAR
ncbi:Inositol 2-dehydrogenase/D-chiro-inositol 3-dehydrogenase [Streptomyces griseomycini]